MQVKFNPYKMGGGVVRKCYRYAEGGDTKSFQIVLTRELKVLAILMVGGAQNVSTL